MDLDKPRPVPKAIGKKFDLPDDIQMSINQVVSMIKKYIKRHSDTVFKDKKHVTTNGRFTYCFGMNSSDKLTMDQLVQKIYECYDPADLSDSSDWSDINYELKDDDENDVDDSEISSIYKKCEDLIGTVEQTTDSFNKMITDYYQEMKRYIEMYKNGTSNEHFDALSKNKQNLDCQHDIYTMLDNIKNKITSLHSDLEVFHEKHKKELSIVQEELLHTNTLYMNSKLAHLCCLPYDNKLTLKNIKMLVHDYLIESELIDDSGNAFLDDPLMEALGVKHRMVRIDEIDKYIKERVSLIEL